MKILMVRRVGGAFGYITDGMVNALRSKGHTVLRYDNDVKTWEIISLLMKYKVINKRSESKGYDKYKESDEYKEKVNA